MSITRIGVGRSMSAGVVRHRLSRGPGGQYRAGKSVTEQTTEILATIDGLLAKAGTDKTKLLSATIYLADISTFAEMNAVWDGWVSKATRRRAPPSRRSWRRRPTRSRSSSSRRAEAAVGRRRRAAAQAPRDVWNMRHRLTKVDRIALVGRRRCGMVRSRRTRRRSPGIDGKARIRLRPGTSGGSTPWTLPAASFSPPPPLARPQRFAIKHQQR